MGVCGLNNLTASTPAPSACACEWWCVVWPGARRSRDAADATDATDAAKCNKLQPMQQFQHQAAIRRSHRNQKCRMLDRRWKLDAGCWTGKKTAMCEVAASSSSRKGTTMGNAESATADSQPAPRRMERKNSEACLSTAAQELAGCKDDARRGARRGGSTAGLRKR